MRESCREGGKSVADGTVVRRRRRWSARRYHESGGKGGQEKS